MLPLIVYIPIIILLDEGFCEGKKNGVVILMHSAYQIFLYVCIKSAFSFFLWKLALKSNFHQFFCSFFFSKKEASVFFFGIFRSLQVSIRNCIKFSKVAPVSCVSPWLIDCLDSPQIFPHYVGLVCWLKVAIYIRCTQLHTY